MRAKIEMVRANNWLTIGSSYRTMTHVFLSLRKLLWRERIAIRTGEELAALDYSRSRGSCTWQPSIFGATPREAIGGAPTGELPKSGIFRLDPFDLGC